MFRKSSVLSCVLISFFILISVHPLYAREAALDSVAAELLKPSSHITGPLLPASNLISLSSGLLPIRLPKIPNFQYGLVYTFGDSLRQFRWTADYLFPFGGDADSTYFVELHGESVWYRNNKSVPFLNNFWQQGSPGSQTRTDLSIGGGYRTLFRDNAFAGINAFYDVSELSGNWKSAGSIGVEFAANYFGDDAFDLNANYYTNVYGMFNSRGSVFPTFNAIDTLRNYNRSYDLEVGYSKAILDRSYDLRLKLNSYQYDFGNSIKRGYKTGADLYTAAGLVKLTAEFGRDDVVGSYGTVAGYLNVGIQLDNLIQGRNPFSNPEPVFSSPRNLKRLLTQNVKRNWHKPNSVMVNARCEGMPPDSAFYVPRDKSCFYVGFRQGTTEACANAGYTIMQYSAGGGWNWVNNYTVNYPVPPYQYSDTDPMWDCASAAFAREVSGVVHAYIYTPRLYDYSSTFHRIELPTLQNNPNVTAVLVYSGEGSNPAAYTFVGDWKYQITIY